MIQIFSLVLERYSNKTQKCISTLNHGGKLSSGHEM